MNHAIIALLFCLLFTGFAVAQTAPKTVKSQPVTTVEVSGVSVEGGRFQSKPGRFKISLAEMPFQTTDLGSEKARAKGVDSGKQYIWKFEKTLYTVLYSPPVDLDGNPVPQVFEDMVSGSREGAVRENAKIISEKPFTAGKFQGTELRYVSEEGATFINRVFIVGDFGYQVVGGYIGANEKAVLDVLNSFEALTSKQ